MTRQEVTTREEVDYIRERGHEPLMLWEVFDLPRSFRRELIEELFPHYSVKNNLRFYRWYWDNYPGERRCEECGVELLEYAAIHVSHILSRGNTAQYAYDPMNCNLLCGRDHTRWGCPIERKSMNIYHANQVRIHVILNSKR